MTAVNDAPSASDDTTTTAEDSAKAVAVFANDTDVDGDALTVNSATDPAHGSTAVNADGTITYTPDAAYHGPDSFDYSISDGHGGTATATVHITVDAINHSPSASDDTTTTAEDTAKVIYVLANDTDPDGDALTVDSASDPAHGSTAVNADGTITYTPDADYNGPDSFGYTVSDGHGGTATATVHITVDAINTPLRRATTRPRPPRTAPRRSTCLANDTDPDGDALTVDSATDPAHGSSAVNADSTITYTPDADYNGPDSFDYTIFDGHGGTATATVYITVTAVNDAPSASDDRPRHGRGHAKAVVVLANDTDADGDALAVDSATDPPHGSTPVNVDHTITYTPDADYNGPDSFDYTISDGHGGTATATVVHHRDAVNDSPSASDDTTTTAEDTSKAVASCERHRRRR